MATVLNHIRKVSNRDDSLRRDFNTRDGIVPQDYDCLCRPVLIASLSGRSFLYATLSPPACLPFICRACQRVCGECMRRTELDPLIFRWKKTTRALKIHEQLYGKYITDLLELRTDTELARFSDPVEAAAFFCLLDLTRRSWPGGDDPACRPCGIPGQCTLVAGDPPAIKETA